MKKVLFLFFAAGATICNAQNLILAGKITHPNSDSLKIKELDKVLHVIPLQKDGTFRDTFAIPTGLYQIFDGKEYSPIYLKSGYNLSITLDTKKFDETIHYKGFGAVENNYLAQKLLINEANTSYTLPEDSFLKAAAATHNSEQNLFKKQEAKMDKDFAYLESRLIEIRYLNELADYEALHRYVTRDTGFRVSADFPNPYANIDLADEKLAKNTDYIGFIKGYIYHKKAYPKYQKDTSLNYYTVFAEVVQNDVPNLKVRNEIAHNVFKYEMEADKGLDTFYARIRSLFTDENYIKEIDEKYALLSRVSHGKPSPNFELTDINGKNISLESLKGKAVYIDIWATWCGPCMREIPELKKLQEEFKNQHITFVSICVKDKKENWEKTVKAKELGGIQLFAPNEKIPFFEAYNLHGIPHFILLDKEGNIVSGHSDRPSNPTIREQLKALL